MTALITVMRSFSAVTLTPAAAAASSSSEIAYVGDTLNVAARLLEASKGLGRDVLASGELLAQVRLPAGLRAEPLPTLSIRGRDAPLEIAALSLRGAPDQG